MTAASDQPGLTTERFEKALVYATQMHARPMRKGTAIPYIAHLLAVAASVRAAAFTWPRSIRPSARTWPTPTTMIASRTSASSKARSAN